MKELFLDSANPEEIAVCIRTDAVAGVTTNPSLMAKEILPFSEHLRSAKEKWNAYVQNLDGICQLFQTNARGKKHLSVEVITLNPKEMYDQAHRLRDSLGKYDKVQLHVKIPVTFQTLEIISRLGDDGIKINATACITALQAKLAHDAGAPIISFFYRRGIDGGEDMTLELNRFEPLNRNSRVICGSIREPMDVYRCWVAGSDIVTAPKRIIELMTQHTKTDQAISQFQKDIEKWLS